MKKLIAVSLIGIPASGKTCLAHKLVEISRNQQLDASVIVISFDDFIKINFSEITTGDYKQSREQLLQKIENLIKMLRDYNEDCWLDKLTTSQLQLESRSFNIAPGCATSLIILDDNMHYRSMRQRIRSICRNMNCAHFQIFIECQLDSAIQRNRNRSSPVPESIIKEMFQKIEAPQNPCTINITYESSDDDLLDMINDRIKCSEDLEEQLSFPQQQSLLHEIDIITRKELNARIKALKPCEYISSTCEILNGKRKEFLENLRTQRLSNTADVESLREAFQRYLDK